MAKDDAEQTLTPKLRFPEFRKGKGWQKKPLDALLDYQQPTPYLVSDTNYSKSFKTPVLTAGKTFVLGYTNEQHGIFDEGLPVIIFDDFTTSTQFVNFPFKAKSSAMKILQAKDGAKIKFMYESLRTISYEVGAHERHWISKFAPMLVFVPEPDEQQKIADCLTSLDDCVAAQERKVAALADHKRGLMEQLFPREGESLPRLRFPGFREPTWAPKNIGDMLEEMPRPIEMDDDQEYSLVTVKRRYGGVVSREHLKGRAIKVKSQFIVKTDDFLISKRQIVHNACGLVPAELDGSIVSNEYSVLCPRKGCDIEFFNFFSQQPAVSASFLQSSVGIVIEKMLFKLNTWLRFEFLFPSIEEQRKIADCLNSIEDQIVAESEKLEALKTHKKALMQQLFPSPEEGL